MLRDAYLDADRAYWLRRGEQFAAVGNPACDEIAAACRARATLSRDIAPVEFRAALPAIIDPLDGAA